MESYSRWLYGLAGLVVGIIAAVLVQQYYVFPRTARAVENTGQASSQTSPSSSTTTPTPAPTVTTESLNNAIVTGVNGTTINLFAGGVSYQVLTNSSTKITTSDGLVIGLNEISVNDVLNISGTYTNTIKTSLLSSNITDSSLAKTTITGTISSINLTNNTFILNTFSGNRTVVVSPSTIITDKNGKVTALPNLNSGDTVTVTGILDNANNNLIQTISIADLNIAL